MAYLASKASSSNVYTKQYITYIDITFGNSLNNKADKLNTYLKTDVDAFWSTVQAGINNRVLINAIDINCNFKILTTTNDILKIQKVDGSSLYDSLEFSFNTTDKTSIVKLNSFDTLASLNLKASASNVYTNQEINDVDIAFAES